MNGQGVLALLGAVLVLLGGLGLTARKADLVVVGAALLAAAFFWEPIARLFAG